MVILAGDGIPYFKERQSKGKQDSLSKNGSVPSSLRPFPVLSNGEQFRAGLARLLLSDETAVVLDEFTSVIDRQVARIASGAFQKAWRRKVGRRAVILTPHYDILPWLEPDWIIDTNRKNYKRGVSSATPVRT